VKNIELLPKASLKVLRGECELSEKDIEEMPKGLSPGEWVLLIDKTAKVKYIAHINPYSESFFKIKIIKSVATNWSTSKKENEVAIDNIREKILEAFNRRKIFLNYSDGCRLIYGSSDSLTGLIVDVYKKYIFVQINVAGIDRFRKEVGLILQDIYPQHIIRFFDNPNYRKQEVLPVYETEEIKDDLEVFENKIKYVISKKTLQKIGYYYDHRENRQKLLTTLKSLNVNKEKGLDLFSYVGSWGLHMLHAGVKNVNFIDQGDMANDVETNLKINEFAGRGTFYRADVFKFLDEAFQKKDFYNVIVSDPPAFTKSEKNKNTAIGGYEKLHQKAMRLIEDQGIFVAASCTHYVSHEELDKTVQVSAIKNNQKVQLLDVGMQGFDHPVKGFTDKGFYIKYLLYIVQKG
jgi:23S rRNA (cytosine1962-C5)-methyltransferase